MLPSLDPAANELSTSNDKLWIVCSCAHNVTSGVSFEPPYKRIAESQQPTANSLPSGRAFTHATPGLGISSTRDCFSVPSISYFHRIILLSTEPDSPFFVLVHTSKLVTASWWKLFFALCNPP